MPAPDLLSAFLSSFGLIALAEVGDKSQLVCMALATRYRAWPVLLGATIAFLLLNLLAVMFGAGIAAWLPERVSAAVVAALFAAFGIHALLSGAGGTEEEQAPDQHSGRSVFVTTLGLILVAEFGDKTQLAVAGLATSLHAGAIWLGASLALVGLSALAVWAGSALLGRLPLHWLHRGAGGLFLLFAAVAAWRALTL